MTTEAVYKYMQVQNKPINANDLISNLDKEKHGKSAIQKSLDKLVDNQKIFVKTYGKQKIYCICQNTNHAKDEILNIERDLLQQAKERKSRIAELEKEYLILEKKLSSMKSTMSFKEAQQEHSRLKGNNSKLTEKLDELMEIVGTEDLSQKKKQAEKDLSLYSKECSKRKRICNSIIDCILESFPGSKKQLLNDIGIEMISSKQ